MKIKRFFAPDIRQAMRMVKEELGVDAVIMSNRTVENGVEIVAARDFDEQLIHNKLQKSAPPLRPIESGADPSPSGHARKGEFSEHETEKKGLHIVNNRRQPADNLLADSPATVKKVERTTAPELDKALSRNNSSAALAAKMSKLQAAGKIQTPAANARASARPEQSVDRLLTEMSQEIKSLKSALTARLGDGGPQISPAEAVRNELLQRLAYMGISKKLSVKIAHRFNTCPDAETAFAKARELLTKVLPVAEDDLLDNGGIAALVGPTGVGKTTTIAKLAAKFILKHGPKQLALITTDNYRIGAHEQLSTYGRILGVPVRVAASAEELRDLLNGFADKKLILVDTAGMSQRDMKLAEQIDTLKLTGLDIKAYLVMSAATEYRALNEIISAFQIFEPQSVIITKLDEAVTTGSAVSSVIENNLPVSFIADGQQVPEDMHKPCADFLIEQCVSEMTRELDTTEEGHAKAWNNRDFVYAI